MITQITYLFLGLSYGFLGWIFATCSGLHSERKTKRYAAATYMTVLIAIISYMSKWIQDWMQILIWMYFFVSMILFVYVAWKAKLSAACYLSIWIAIVWQVLYEVWLISMGPNPTFVRAWLLFGAIYGIGFKYIS